MVSDQRGGEEVYRAGYFRGLRPEPELWVDEWADRYMRIPQSSGAAEPGPYRTERTPYAREPMRCLSPSHPCKRVVTMVASQLMKTQIALNWIGGCIHMAPANILLLEPTQKLAQSVAGRVDQAVEAVPELRARVVVPRSRKGTNTWENKQFEGGRLFIATAGSSSNLAEKSVRYVYGDEVDRWEMDIDNEGDPVKLAEARASTFGRNAKFYFPAHPRSKVLRALLTCSKSATSVTTTSHARTVAICKCLNGPTSSGMKITGWCSTSAAVLSAAQ